MKYRSLKQECIVNHAEKMSSLHSMLNFGRTIFPGVWEQISEGVMRHGSQASDEIEDDLYQYNVE